MARPPGGRVGLTAFLDVEETTTRVDSPRPTLARGSGTLILALTLALLAILVTPEFSTQDGPAHLYNARILDDALMNDGRGFGGTFAVVWRPLPNWAGHLATMAAVGTLPRSLAARLMTALPLLGFSAAVLWLRWRVAGGRGLGTVALASAILGLNLTWLLGFTSFLIGAAVSAVTLGVWWGGRERFGPARAVAIAALLVLGYFCHPVSLGVTLLGLAVLTTLTPGIHRGARSGWTLASGLPLIPLVVTYVQITRVSGGLEPVWEHRSGWVSARSWLEQMAWVDPISLAPLAARPFGETGAAWHAALAPAVWTTVALAILAWSSLRSLKQDDRRAWLVLAGLLVVAGVLLPDTLGPRHGNFLPQRVGLLGLVALLPWLELDPGRPATRVGSLMLGFAVLVQSAFVWDYAGVCRDRVGLVLQAGKALAPGSRVATLWPDINVRFRANPWLHADCYLGLQGGKVVWNNYETSHYYFPVKIPAGVDHPDPRDLEVVALLDRPEDAARRAELWAEILGKHAAAIDAILEWGEEPALDAIHARQYVLTFQRGPVRVWTRRGRP
jgi:hypothetical protein